MQDNLNTHKAASLHKAIPPAEARRIAERFELHYTPKHGSWLNIPNTNSGFSADNASPGTSLIKQLWPPRSRRRKQLETASAQNATGNSRPKTPEPNSLTSTPK